MEFRTQPDFMQKSDEPRFFVRTLDETDAGFARGYRFQIQFLDNAERGGASIDFAPEESPGDECPLPLPEAVVAAARRGVTDYVDSEGFRRLPGFLGGGRIEDTS